jgi:hypothetical protein
MCSYPLDKQGFFVKLNDYNFKDSFKGPFAFLSEARSEVKSNSEQLEIYHGILTFISEIEIDSNKLFKVNEVSCE